MLEKEIKMAERVSTSEFPDWTNLPQLAVQLISEKVKSIADYVRFRAVCCSWRFASLPKPCHLPPQLPWLMIHHAPWVSRDERDDGIRLFYDLWESKMRKLHLPETIGMVCLASRHGWLLLTSTRGEKVFLLNPLTRARIQLPPFTYLLLKHVKDGWDGCYTFRPQMSDLRISKVTFSADLTDPNCLITVFFVKLRMLLCCRVGEPGWTVVINHPGELLDATYNNGRFYLLYKGAIWIIESNKPQERIVYTFELESRAVGFRFLEGKSGIYVVAVEPIELYQFQEQSFKLEQITDTDNTAIFSGRGDFCLAVCSDDWDWVDHVGGNFMHAVALCGASYFHICSTKLDNGKSEVVCDVNAEQTIDSFTWFQPSFV